MARTRNTNIVDVKLDDASFKRAMERILKYEGRDWRGRVIAAFMEGARLLVAPMRRAAPVRSGRLSRSVQAKLAKKGFDVVVKVNVKPRRPKGNHSHLVTQGHRTTTGGTTRPNPFIDKVIDAHEGRVIKFIQTQPLDIKGASVSGFINGLRGF